VTERVPEHIAVFRRVRAAFGDPALRSADARRRRRAAQDVSTVPYGVGRDPRGLGDIVAGLTASRGWDSPIARAELVASWEEVVGADTAAHSTPVAIEDGVLTVRCDSTAWAQQLRLMRASILDRVTERFGAAGVETARFVGPDAPSWKHGLKTIPGRGPRDTYG
jgi:predicted nucleic acid-binding Zn ribbon protein